MSKKVSFKTREGKDVEFTAKDSVAGGAGAKAQVDDIVTNSIPDQILTERNNKTDLQDPARQGMAEQFPADFSQYDKRDAIQKLKLQMQDKTQPGITPMGMLKAEEADWEWLEKKRRKAELVQLHKWFSKWYDRAAPEQKRMAHELYPEFYAMREKVLKRNVKLAGQIASIKLHGPRSKRDLMLKYAVDSGYIESDPLENILHPERAAAQQQAENRRRLYVRGLLNPRARNRGTAGDRTLNASTLTGYDMRKYAGRPDLAGTGADGDTGFKWDPLAVLKMLRDETADVNQATLGDVSDASSDTTAASGWADGGNGFVDNNNNL